MKTISNLENAIIPSDYVACRAAVTTNEVITVPAGATRVRFAATAPFVFKFGATNAVTATAPVDNDTGTADELINPACPLQDRTVTIPSGMGYIGVAAPASSNITAAFFSH